MLPTVPLAVLPLLTFIDWLVIALYGMLMLFIGWYYSKRNKTQEDYLLGGRRMNPTSVGISLFATLLSTLSYLSSPGEMIKHGPAIFSGVIAFPAIYYVAGWWLIPHIMKMKVTSAYEILEKKLGLSVRMLATGMFISLRFLWMATIVYVTVNVAVLSVIDINPKYTPFISVVLMAITIVYTSMGGLKAVIMTDLIQSGIFLGGAVLSIVIVCMNLESLTAIFPTQWPAHWDTLRFGFDVMERSSVGNAALGVFTWYVCTTGSDQMAIQRYLSTKDIRDARKTLRVSFLSAMLSDLLLGLLGLAMLAFYVKNQQFLLPGQALREQADTLFPRFIMIGLPAGLSGLVISGLLAAAMSSMSSGLSSVSSVIAEDVLKRFRNKSTVAPDPLKLVKRLTYVVGSVVIALSFFVANVPGNLFEVIMKVVNLFVAPLFVLFFMALFVPFATERATFLAGILAVGAAVSVAFYSIFGITILWMMPCSLVAGVLAGIILSFLDRLFFKNRRESQSEENQ
jgi:solute:Na+ symporter, SSS family